MLRCTRLRPKLYRTLLHIDSNICYSDLQPILHPIYPSEICKYAKHVFVEYPRPTLVEHAVAMLDLCPNIESLAFWTIHGLSDIRSSASNLFHLRQLSIYFDSVSMHELLEFPFAHQLTHLEVRRPDGRLEYDADILRGFPNLSHFALTLGYVKPQQLKKSVQQCRNIRVLIIYTDSEFFLHPDFEQLYIDDIRMIPICDSMRSRTDWLLGTNGGYDTWRWAEHMIHARKCEFNTASNFCA